MEKEKGSLIPRVRASPLVRTERAMESIVNGFKTQSERSSERDERYRRMPPCEASDLEGWMDLNHYVDEEMDGSSGYSYEESDVTDYSDDHCSSRRFW